MQGLASISKEPASRIPCHRSATSVAPGGTGLCPAGNDRGIVRTFANRRSANRVKDRKQTGSGSEIDGGPRKTLHPLQLDVQGRGGGCMRISIDLSTGDLELLDTAAQQLRVSRNALVRRALTDFLAPSRGALADEYDSAGVMNTREGPAEEGLRYLQTITEILRNENWLTAAMLNRLQPNLPPNPSLPAHDWKECGKIFGVTCGVREYFPRYQFDSSYQPISIISEVLEKFGTRTDPWKIAAWFHYPNGWIVGPGPEAARSVAPKDALDRPKDVLNALNKHMESYCA